MGVFLESKDEFFSTYEHCGKECLFYNGCYTNPELCVKKAFDDVLITLTPREAYVLKRGYGYDGYVCGKQELAIDIGVTCERLEQIEAKALRKLRHPSRSYIFKKYIYDVYRTGKTFYSTLLDSVFGELDDDTKVQLKLAIDFSIVNKEKCLSKSPAEVKKDLNKRIDEIQEFFPYIEKISNLNILTFDHLLHTSQSSLLSLVFNDNDAELFQFKELIKSMGYSFKGSDFDFEDELAGKVARIIKDGSLLYEVVEDLSIKTTMKLLKYDIYTYEDLLDNIFFIISCDEFTQEETEDIRTVLLSKELIYKNDNNEFIYLTNRFINVFCARLVRWMIVHKQPIFKLTDSLKEQNLNMVKAIHYIKNKYQYSEAPTKIFATKTPIEELVLSVRSYNCLKRAGVSTLEQLLELTDEDLMKIKNLGRKCVDEIGDALSKISACRA